MTVQELCCVCKVPRAVAEYDIVDHELPTFVFLEVGIENKLLKLI